MLSEYYQLFISWIELHSSWAELIVFLIALAESLVIVGLLIPGVAMMFAAGALIGTGTLSFSPICLAAILGAIAGDGISFWLGRHYHVQLLAIWPLSGHPKLVESGTHFFHRHGAISVMLGRFFGPIRAIIPFIAGMLDMSAKQFVTVNVVSALLWAPAYLIPGVLFGSSLEEATEMTQKVVLALIVSIIVGWTLFRFVQFLRRQN
ncbi:MAG: hypothetical protein DRQ61_03275 [Gammaproteobacteria bacterium]|nr:MAG: hypothetical protein DRQ56_06205 [Gammaproteobacteria bacterium]RLA23649.1 MAG: hypothetical protein DRQ61_03275 [Gammaproteobacteria bacterium]